MTPRRPCTTEAQSSCSKNNKDSDKKSPTTTFLQHAATLLCAALVFTVCVCYGQEFIPSVPPGGGAGIFGESSGDVSVDAATGVLRTAIPFQLPTARGPIQPSLALSYSSG